MNDREKLLKVFLAEEGARKLWSRRIGKSVVSCYQAQGKVFYVQVFPQDSYSFEVYMPSSSNTIEGCFEQVRRYLAYEY